MINKLKPLELTIWTSVGQWFISKTKFSDDCWFLEKCLLSFLTIFWHFCSYEAGYSMYITVELQVEWGWKAWQQGYKILLGGFGNI